jgi:hypothetical protein
MDLKSGHIFQSWLRGVRPSDGSIKSVFKVTERVLEASRNKALNDALAMVE